MEKILRTAAVVTVVIGLTASAALAQFNTAYKGKSFKANLQTTYNACTVPNAMSDDGFDACTPVSRVNTGCQFGGGQGKIQFKHVTVGKVSFRSKLTGLDTSCEGSTLTIVATLRRTGNFCGGSSCTLADNVDFPISACVVQNGACSANGQIILPGGTALGETEIKDAGVLHNGLKTFDIGIVQNN